MFCSYPAATGFQESLKVVKHDGDVNYSTYYLLLSEVYLFIYGRDVIRL